MTAKTKPLAVVPHDHPLQMAGSAHLGRLEERTHLQLHSDPVTTVDEQLRRAHGAEIIINSRGALTWPGEVLRQLPELKMITTCSIGIDSIDVAAARELGIVVSNVPGRTAKVVAEHALALLLAAARRLSFMTAELRNGRWSGVKNSTLQDKRLGVIGTGAIGGEMIRLGRAIGMQVQAWTFHPSAERAAQLDVNFVELDELLSTSDAISIHCKLTEDSRHLIGRRELSLLRPGSFLINTARGAVVDTAALIEALDSGHLGGAGLDVYDIEPLPSDAPILACEHVVLTPHNADQSPEGMELLNGGAVDNVLAFLDGKPQNQVN